MKKSSRDLWLENLAALGRWGDALLTKDKDQIDKAVADMDKTADAYLAARYGK